MGTKSFTNPKGEVSKLNGKGKCGEPNFSGQTAGDGIFFFVQIGFSSIKILFFGNYGIITLYILTSFIESKIRQKSVRLSICILSGGYKLCQTSLLLTPSTSDLTKSVKNS
jgi:hypothetical protein